MGEAGKKGTKSIDFLCAIFIGLSIWVGYMLSPYIYKYLYNLSIYIVIANLGSSVISLGIGIPNIFACVKSGMRWAIKKIKFASSFWKRLLCVLSIFVWVVLSMWTSFVLGISIRNTREKSGSYEIGDRQYLDDLESDCTICITIVLEDGSVPQNRNCRYEILDVQPKVQPLWKIILDFPRYFICRQAGTGPIEVTVKPVSKSEITVLFCDPLISYRADVVMWANKQSLLGELPAQSDDNFTPYFTYSLDGIEWKEYTINETENLLSFDQENVWLKWCNNWELSYRQFLNQQCHSAKGGDIVYFYYPAERVAFNLDMLHHSESSNILFADKLKIAEQYRLSLESMNPQAVRYNENLKKESIHSDSALPDQSPSLIKAGAEIVYHCYDGLTDLGYYYITTPLHEEVVWEETKPLQGEMIILRLDIV